MLSATWPPGVKYRARICETTEAGLISGIGGSVVMTLNVVALAGIVNEVTLLTGR
jgi:hypothetical protein